MLVNGWKSRTSAVSLRGVESFIRSDVPHLFGELLYLSDCIQIDCPRAPESFQSNESSRRS